MVDEQWLINDIAKPIDEFPYGEANIFKHATRFNFKLGVYGTVGIELRSLHKDGSWLWSVKYFGGMVWHKGKKDFVHDWLPSWRKESFEKQTEMTFIEALQVIQLLRDRAIKHRKETEKELQELRNNKQ